MGIGLVPYGIHDITASEARTTQVWGPLEQFTTFDSHGARWTLAHDFCFIPDKKPSWTARL